jgi:Fe-Mn family superoxide dismutase
VRTTHTIIFTALAALVAGSPAVAAEPAPAGSFTLAPLPYAFDALAPAIDAQTMEIHWGKHHQAYVDNLNKQVAATPELAGKSLEAILANVSSYNVAVRNNGGGHWNHTFFWSLMGPAATSGKPSPALEAALVSTFGSLDAFKIAFETAGLTRFGSGWAWLVLTPEGKLVVTSTPNQDNPLMDIAEVKGTPILANDVWEHAYYLHYQNRRGDYLKSWWSVVNWEQVSKNYDAAIAR